ncbi:hypothetical protein FBUS_08841 [Fasciolopsis buskii]|uniref:G-protein coupled receptors family 1 profile domain-containing protein n=1 Tax=Fasciolopsis buskii TaxID=27845 RepID=A0A8E0RVU1_9TREM|nr:hypothetical protein FBUS_08841 [Fasciolopsis buski]
MNTTLKIYKSISTPSLSLPVCVTFTVLMSFSLCLHIFMAFTLYHTKIPSPLTKLLLYQQCTLDGFYSILVIVLANTNNFTQADNTVPTNPVLCYIFQSGFLTITVRVMSFCNIVCQSADRVWALVFPQTYRVYTKYYIAVCCTFIPIFSSLSTSIRIAKATLSGGSCVIKDLPISKYVVAAIESSLRYGIPMCFLIFTNVLVIRTLYKLRMINFGSTKKTQISLSSHGSGASEHKDNSTKASSSLQTALFLNVFFLTMEVTVIECIPIVFTVLNFNNVIRYDVGSIARVYHMCVVVMLNDLNPCVGILTIKTLRSTIKRNFKKLASFGNKNETDSCACASTVTH